MPQTRTSCPRCRQPVTANVEQLFDVNTDPSAKQRFLSGQFNLINCPHCGYQGNLAVPLVYHDPEKELLLTYFPPELGVPVNEQERSIGPLITQAVNNLLPEKRKAYLFRSQTMLTLQAMLERVLEADGITKEMIQAQQARLSLIQRMLVATKDARLEMALQEADLVDESVFGLINRLIEAALGGGDEASAHEIAEVQKVLLENTPAGQRIQGQAQEAQEAMKSLQEAQKKGLTRESLLDLMIDAPSETRLLTLVSMARGGMDYAFFQILSDRIENASGDERAKLEALRERMLQLTKEIDEELKVQSENTGRLLEEILKADNIEEATTQAMPAITQLFVDILNGELQQARQKGDLDRLGQLNKIVGVLQKASQPPPEYAVLEELMEAGDDAARRQLLEQHKEEITPEFIDLIYGLMTQSDGQDPELVEKLQAVHRSALRFSMESNLKK